MDDFLEAQDWVYLGEGGGNIVFSFVNFNQNETHANDCNCKICSKCNFFEGKVLRINKRNFGEKQRIEEIIDFGKDLICPFFGNKTVEIGTIIRISFKFLVKVLQLSDKKRSSKRKDVHPISKIIGEGRDEKCHIDQTKVFFAQLQNNLTIFPFELKPKCKDSITFSIELKPKWGFVPTYPVGIDPIKKVVCQYCMLQFLKEKNGNVAHISSYCPLDLYSLENSRMNTALHHLLKNPQNNIRIFSGHFLSSKIESKCAIKSEFAVEKKNIDLENDEDVKAMLYPFLKAVFYDYSPNLHGFDCCVEGNFQAKCFCLLSHALTYIINNSEIRNLLMKVAVIQKYLDRYDVQNIEKICNFLKKEMKLSEGEIENFIEKEISSSEYRKKLVNRIMRSQDIYKYKCSEYPSFGPSKLSLETISKMMRRETSRDENTYNYRAQKCAGHLLKNNGKGNFFFDRMIPMDRSHKDLDFKTDCLRDKAKLIRILSDFIISHTWKDLSVIITLNLDCKKELSVVGRIIDVDSKPIDKLWNYIKRDHKILQNFRNIYKSKLAKF